MNIHFRFKEIEEIKESLSHFESHKISPIDLMDGDFFIEIAGQELYIYSKEILEYYQDDDKYIDYQISSFETEFAECFYGIRKSISRNLYEYFVDAKSIQSVWDNLEKFSDLHPEIWNKTETSAFKDFHIVSSFLQSRYLLAFPTFDVPEVYFFRHKDLLKIIWNAEQECNGIPLWSAKSGVYEMSYSEFVIKIKNFYTQYLAKMKKQVKKAIDNTDWGKFTFDKEYFKKYYENFEKMKRDYYLGDLELLDMYENENSEIIEETYKKIEIDVKTNA